MSQEQQEINKQNYEKRLASALELLKIKNSVVMDKSRDFYGVLSIDKKNPKESKYYKVDPSFCDCIDFTIHIEANNNFQCKHMIALAIVLKSKKIVIMDISKLLRRESL